MRLPRRAARRGTPPERSASTALLAYNAWRLLLLVGCLAIGYALRLPGLWLVVSALIVSGILSLFLLKRQRIAMGMAVESQVERGRRRLAQKTAEEDAYADALAAQQAQDVAGAGVPAPPPSRDSS
jgi:Protein of unknown function (DUF4229)